jgi:hypothetical protein
MSKNIDDLDRPGGTPSGLVSQVRNLLSQDVYNISTVFQAADECWTTIIVPCTPHQTWFGLVKKYKPDVNQRHLLVFFRNSQKEAYEVHTLVRQMVTNHKKEDWDSVAPELMPPDGFSEKMQRKLTEMWGDSLTDEIRSKFRY